MYYPATFTQDPTGGYVVRFRDIPEALTQGDDEADASDMAQDALITAIDFYFEDQRPVPLPSKIRSGERLVDLIPSVAVKILLLNEMLTQNVRPADLARRMEVLPQEVTRLLKLDHKTKIDTVAQALHALGRRLEFSLV
jgi:antitoxin HicB